MLLKIADHWPTLIAQIVSSTFSAASAGATGVASAVVLLNQMVCVGGTTAITNQLSPPVAQGDWRKSLYVTKVNIYSSLVISTLLGVILSFSSVFLVAGLTSNAAIQDYSASYLTWILPLFLPLTNHYQLLSIALIIINKTNYALIGTLLTYIPFGLGIYYFGFYINL